MTPRVLFNHTCTYPLMYGKTFLEVAQFLNGYDAGYTAASKFSTPRSEPEFVGLSRFREWLANKMGGPESRFWETIIEQAFPNEETRFKRAILLFNEFNDRQT
ncbi:MAG: hypothetical protein ACRYFS_24335 [Janthinobacterium lividum]